MRKKNLKPFFAGLMTGLCNGLLGAGGGMIAVVALERLCGLPTKEAHATAISVILPLSAVSGAIYLWQGQAPWSLLLWVAPALTLGGFLGAKLTGRLPDKLLRRLFAALMLVAGGWMLL